MKINLGCQVEVSGYNPEKGTTAYFSRSIKLRSSFPGAEARLPENGETLCENMRWILEMEPSNILKILHVCPCLRGEQAREKQFRRIRGKNRWLSAFVTVEMKHIVNESIKHQYFIIVTRMPGER